MKKQMTVSKRILFTNIFRGCDRAGFRTQGESAQEK